MSDQPTPQNELRDPATSAERLAAIAATNPELGADIAWHPNAYDGLLDWLRDYGDEAARAAVLERRTGGRGTAQTVPAADPVIPQAAPAMPVAPAGAPTAGRPAPAKKTSKKGLTIGLIAGGLVVVLGGGGAVWAFTSIFGGSKSPEAAAEKIFEGALELDPIALYTAMSPSEVKPLKDALEQLNDLPTSDEDDAKDVQETLQAVVDAIEITTDGLEYRTDEMMEGVSRVSLVGGTFELDADTDELGEAMRDFMEVSMRVSLEQSGYYSDEEIDELLEESLDAQVDYMLDGLDGELPLEVDFAAGQGYPFSVITVDEGGWYTSPLLTVVDLFAGAEMIRGGYDYGDELVEADTFGSPEDAAHGLADGLVDFVSEGDYEALAAALPLAERRALSLYGPALAEISLSEGAGLSDFDVEVEKTNGLTGLRISDLEFLQDGGVVGTYTHPCFEGSYHGGEQCIDDVPALELLGLDEALPIAIKENGGWFVSPTATLGNAMAIMTTNLSQLIEDDELDKLFEF
jgi:hypothetical protein